MLGLAKFYLGLARNSKLENILMLSVSKLPFQRIFWGQRLFRSTASPIQRTNNLAVGARVSDIYLGLAPKLKLENILMLSLTDGHFRDPPRANAVLFVEIYDFLGLKYALSRSGTCTGTRNYRLSESLA